MTISDLDLDSPASAKLSDYPGELQAIKAALQDSLPNSTAGTIMGLVSIDSAGDVDYQLEDGQWCYIRAAVDLAFGDDVTLPDGTIVKVSHDLAALAVYQAVRSGNNIDLVFEGDARIRHVGATITRPQVATTYDFSQYQIVEFPVLQRPVFTRDTMINPDGPCWLTVIAENTNFQSIECWNESFSDVRASGRMVSGKSFIDAANSTPGMWDMFYDGANYYITDYDELGQL